MNSGGDSKYISFTFDTCISVNQMAGYIADDLKKQDDVKVTSKMYKNVDYTKDAFFCADQVICIKNYCKNSIYNPVTQLCYYAHSNSELIEYNSTLFEIN